MDKAIAIVGLAVLGLVSAVYAHLWEQSCAKREMELETLDKTVAATEAYVVETLTKVMGSKEAAQEALYGKSSEKEAQERRSNFRVV